MSAIATITPVSGSAAVLSIDSLVEMLAEVRERTMALLAPLSNDEVTRQHDPLMSPIVWDLGHIAAFEELWLLRHLENPDAPVTFGEMPGTYNPFENPRRVRGALKLPSLRQAQAHLAAVRAQTLERLATFDPTSESPLLRDGYVYRMVAQHEAQHQETIMQTLQVAGLPCGVPMPFGSFAEGNVLIPAGTYTMGTFDRSAAYDNERPQHTVTLFAFRIETAPVTNGQYLAFMNDGGYHHEELWSAPGRAWLAEARREGIAAPKYWVRGGDKWWTRIMHTHMPVDPAQPVRHISAFEAEAYAQWAGKRLPTEAEWEVAASRGVLRGIGAGWEWTASDFTPYPGFEAFPYREYSEAFFGSEYRVLRGHAWATHPLVARTTFRNWDYPIRRQIFSGLRCVAGTEK